MYGFVGSATTYNNSGVANPTVGYSPTVGNTLVAYNCRNAYSATDQVSDTGGNVWNLLGVQSGELSMFYSPVTVGGALTFQWTGSGSNGFYLQEISGLSSTPYISGSFQGGSVAGPGVGSNLIATTTEPDVITVPSLLIGLAVNGQAVNGNADGGPTAGTSLAYNTRVVGWLGSASQQAALAQDVRITSVGNQPMAFSSVSSGQYDNYYVVAAAFAEATASTPPSSMFLTFP